MITEEKLAEAIASHRSGCSSSCHSFEEMAKTLSALWRVAKSAGEFVETISKNWETPELELLQIALAALRSEEK